ncbi:MAG TPA: hypothetical protein VNU96_00250 [Burkholderiales bacterium]|jgi:hypothetical protein|nr:hypothetical protein [Burkholderiales bacterium]
MQLDDHRSAVHLSDAATAPEAGGVYVLWRDARPVYVGRTAEGQSLRHALEWHLDKSDAEADPATHFTCEPCADPAAREAEARLLTAKFRLSGGTRS